MIKGIPASSHSPMDVTSAAEDRAPEKKNLIVRTLVKDLGAEMLKQEYETYHSRKLKIGKFTILLSLEKFQLYPRSEGLDSGYKQSAVVVTYL